jgi:hypothetical protein
MRNTMRNKTKDELSKLAEIMVSKYQIDTILGTGDFLETALSEARRSKIEVDNQSIKRYEKELAMKCKALNEHIEYSVEQQRIKEIRKSGLLDDLLIEINEELDLELDDNFYNVYGDAVDDMSIIKRASEIMNRFLTKDVTNEFFDGISGYQYVPNYSMFVEGEDGLMVIKGSYKGKNLDEIDEVNFKGAKRGWAKWCLDNDKNLTDDDRNVFTKILLNQM